MTLIDRFKASDIIVKLIAVNAMVFLASLVALGIFAGSAANPEDFNPDDVDLLLSATADFKKLPFRFWTPITYMFAHRELGHIFWNMLVLYLGGMTFFRLFNARNTLAMYLVGGIAGFLTFAILFKIFPAFNPESSMLGASAAVFALLAAAATHSPNALINLRFFQVKVWIVAAVYIVTNLVALKSYENIGGTYAHLGGAAYGFIWASQMKKGKNIGAWMERLVDKLANLFKKGTRTKMKVVKNERRGGKTDAQYNVDRKVSQAKVDSILDKISKSGYDSLTKAEKDILFKQGDK